MPFQRMSAAVVMAFSATSLWLTPAVIAQSMLTAQSPFETNEDRDIFNTLPDAKRQGSVLDATNPMELMQWAHDQQQISEDNLCDSADYTDQVFTYDGSYPQVDPDTGALYAFGQFTQIPMKSVIRADTAYGLMEELAQFSVELEDLGVSEQ